MGNPSDVIRMDATFNGVFSPDSLQIPWYLTGGAPDWQGNISGTRRVRSRAHARHRPFAPGMRLARALPACRSAVPPTRVCALPAHCSRLAAPPQPRCRSTAAP
jgi:hypothetical protein